MNFLWNLFEKSGRIDAYMLYKKNSGSSSHEISDEAMANTDLADLDQIKEKEPSKSGSTL